MPVTIYQVDAFTTKPFKGNPAAVCILPEEQTAEWMQQVAMEMNLSETAFLVKQEDGFQLRWFTPKVEVELCGHATLASAHILYEQGILAPDEPVEFYTRSGVLLANRQEDGWIELNFPARPVVAVEAPATLETALGVKTEFIGSNQMDYLVEVAEEEQVRTLRPDFGVLATVPVRGVIVTAAANTGSDFVSRFFAPVVGINEDPVTGSAHCALAPYWAGKLQKTELTAFQASSRGGELRLAVKGTRVHILGQAVTVFQGTLLW
ncbi:phenazine biosynthesis phzf protein [Lucifera butyrica]|uniref:Phenazine biosynthesis phzf protein n=2 Tax=Lucifera butyrica TaxID=1351585 RepID=A0A498R654_9FIRM|nr:phenazine biosynthesis phzf protein [Lucifera butyrica]